MPAFVQHADISDRAWSILGYRSRLLPRVSPTSEALTLSHSDSPELRVLGGVGMLRMLDALKCSFAF